ncbi:1-aminocyclopropane-1-carboxylate deaminase [Sulfurimonas sp. HSL3-7]|uniref:1-aminocyclopropane-1-carboxylate deaminase n=1 Tax=Sulfonitrofixus jiaomeiensis TaxID=3131938 RepID=UPI0031F7B21C
MRQRSRTESNILPSAVELFEFQGRKLYIKRDDLLDEDLSGNKFRKLYSLLNTPKIQYKRILSYGGNQSNAMASIAALCKRKGWEFIYITKELSATLKQNPTGNLEAALSDGMKLIEVTHDAYREVVQSLYSPTPDSRIQVNEDDLVLAQGGADLGAKEGVELLAEEIKVWQIEHNIEKLTVVTPSGTGTTAYFLAAAMPDITVLTTPLIGTKTYLIEQMHYLGPLPKNLQILETEKRYRFAKMYPEYLELYQKLLRQGVEIDLLYAPKTLIALYKELNWIEGDILYVHSGGLKGNLSMIERYRHKGFI